MKNISNIVNNIKNYKKINNFLNLKDKIINYIIGPFNNYLEPYNFFIIYLQETKLYYLVQTTVDNDLLCLNIFNTKEQLKLLTLEKNEKFKLNISNGEFIFYKLNNKEIYISNTISKKFIKYF